MSRKSELKAKQKGICEKFSVMKACFWGFIVGNTTNIIGLLWLSEGGMEVRIIINYIVWPLLGCLLGNKLFRKYSYNDVRIKSIGLNNLIIIIILALSLLGAALNIKYEQEKMDCKRFEISIENYSDCLNEADNNIFNIGKLF